MPDDAPTATAEDLKFAVDVVRRSGALALESFKRGDAQRHTKPDGTIVTDADIASSDLICAAIAARYPDDAVVSDERPPDHRRFSRRRCWLIDPIDGTHLFAEGKPGGPYCWAWPSTNEQR